jgi:hypothetical protein
MSGDEDAKQEREWESLFRRIAALLKRFGTQDAFGRGDFLLVDDNYGWKLQKIEVQRLHMLRPEIVKNLRRLLREFPDWEITIAVDVPGTESTWPNMGVIIRSHEVVDGLQREYLPDEFQMMEYDGSRRGSR